MPGLLRFRKFVRGLIISSSVKVYANNDDGRAYLNENYLLGVGNIDFPIVSFNTRNQTEQNETTEGSRTKR